ncbi:MAG: hypothetical protein AAB794_04605 [Patescibacteria group bacterium]
MTPLIFILVTIALLGGFLALTDYEVRRGTRFFALQRARLDHTVERAEFIFTHIDFGAFVRDEIRAFVARMGHDIAHLFLQAIRAVERLLTRFVRYMRSRHEADTAPGENVREFVKTLSDFKGSLKATHPEISDIESK